MQHALQTTNKHVYEDLWKFSYNCFVSIAYTRMYQICSQFIVIQCIFYIFADTFYLSRHSAFVASSSIADVWSLGGSNWCTGWFGALRPDWQELFPPQDKVSKLKDGLSLLLFDGFEVRAGSPFASWRAIKTSLPLRILSSPVSCNLKIYYGQHGDRRVLRSTCQFTPGSKEYETLRCLPFPPSGSVIQTRCLWIFNLKPFPVQ